MKLLHGDCLELMKNIPDKSVDMILCDLPYGTTACKWDTIIPFDKLWEQYNRIIKDNGAIVLNATQPFTSALVMSNTKMFKYCWTWNKGTHSNPLLAKKQPLRVSEDIVIFCKKGTLYNPQMEQKQPYKRDYGYKEHNTETISKTKLFSNNNKTGLRYPKNIINIGQPKNNRKYNHPTQKPVPLCEYLIKTYTNEGDLVLDNCMGSGTTGVACVNTNRDFIGIELDDEYYEVASNRVYSSLSENRSEGKE